MALATGAAGLADPNTGEHWTKRVREGALTSPSGTRIKYLFEDVRRAGNKRGTAFEFPGVDGAYIQQHGFGARRYPMRFFFSGAQHDLEATAFELALYESGIIKLEHPFYGPLDVVTFGDINRRDDLKTAANQTIVETTLWTTLGALYPSSRGAPKNEISAALGSFDVVASQEFEASTSLVTAGSRASTKSTVRGFLKDIGSALRVVSDGTAGVRRDFEDQIETINLGIDVLIGQPVLLARQLANLTRTPARALAGIISRLEGYQRLYESIFASEAGTVDVALSQASLRNKQVNDFQVAQLVAMNAAGGSVDSVLRHDFSTKPEALKAAEDVLAQFEQVVAWREAGFVTLAEPDFGGAYQRLQTAVALTVGFLVEISFSLVPEKRITLDRARTIVDLAAELYGSVDDRLDLMINSNGLTGSEILELPRGRVIRYYPNA